ncbi:MAG: PPC domain-containing protein [Solirubrobacterales bacterium]|nr:PPC domain-containing protein [Solirubrobacterales bacterium]
MVRSGRALLLALVSVAALLALAPVASAAAPANDDFANASVLSPTLPVTGSGSNQEATKEAGEPDHAGDPGGHSVWHSWTPTVSGPVGISTPGCFNSFPALVAVYTGSAVNALTPVAGNQGLPTPVCFGESAEVEFTASAGTTYWIAIDGRSGAQGSYEFTLKGAPENDDFADAQVVSAEPPQTVAGSTRFAGKQTGEPDHAGDPGGHSVWYSWTPTTSGPISISTCSSFYSLDTLLGIYTGSAVGSLTPVASNDDAPAVEGFPGCAAANSEVRFDADAGTTYKIAVDSTGGTSGRFTLRLRGRPANDDFANAQVLPAALNPTFPIGVSGATTDMATEQSGEPDHAGAPGGQSVWFSWTPSASGRVLVSTCTHEGPEGPDTLLAAYTGSAVNALTPVVSNDDATGPNCRASDSEASFIASAGTTYRIAVDSKSPSHGRFDLKLEGASANDDFGDSQTLAAALPSSATGSTKFTTREAGEPAHGGEPGGHSVWFAWTPASSGPVIVTACPYTESIVPVLGVYTGSAVNALTPVAGDSIRGASCRSTAAGFEFDAVAGTTYRIAVDGEAGSLGLFSLEIQGRPTNDEFATPEVLSPTPMTAGGIDRLATKQAGEPNHAGDPGGHSLWFSWTPSSSGPVEISACGYTREIDTLLAVYTGSAVNALTPVASNDDASGPPPNQLCQFSRGNSEVVFNAVAGTTYRIAVDGKGGSVGRFGLAFERAPANDDFSAAQSLSAGLPSYGNAVTKLATKQAGEPSHASDPGGHSVWFTWMPSSSGQVTISTCAYYGDLDPLFAVYTGSAVNSLTPVVSAEDDPPGYCRSNGSEAQFDAVAGTTYRIAVDGKGGSSGGFQLILEGVAPNDDFGRPMSLGGGLPSRNFFASNRFATKQAGEPDHAGNAGGASVWFKWTAPVSTEVSIDTCGSGFDTLLAVYTGSAVNALTPIAGNDDAGGKCSPRSKVGFAAVANTTYRIAVDGKNGAQGAIKLNVDARPANDAFEAAETTPAPIGWYWSGTTSLASKQAGEPNHAGDPGGHSVWYSWTPGKSAAVELDACTSSFEPLLGIYTGTAVNALTAVATTDSGLGQCDEGASTAFDAVAGTTYLIAVDGAGGDSGYFELHLRAAVEHPRSLSIASAGGGAGSVVSFSAPIACDSSCSYRLEVGETVTLDAQPTPGSTFSGWSGAGCSGTGACQVTLNADTSVVANFAPAPSGGNGGGGGAAPAPTPNPPATPKPGPKPLRCKPGFKKSQVHGKAKCVKKKRKPRRHSG